MDKDHSLRENLLALTLGSALVSLGVIFFSKVGLLTGGTAGLAYRFLRSLDPKKAFSTYRFQASLGI